MSLGEWARPQRNMPSVAKSTGRKLHVRLKEVALLGQRNLEQLRELLVVRIRMHCRVEHE